MTVRPFDVKPLHGPWHLAPNPYDARLIPGTSRLYQRAEIGCLPNGAGHGGRDIDADSDDKILRAVWDGTIHRYGWDDFGNHIGLVNSDGHEAFYAHLQTVHVGDGQAVTADSDLGILGATGNVTGPHCHFEIRVLAMQWCSAIDPTDWLLEPVPQPSEDEMLVLKDFVHAQPGQNPPLFISLGDAKQPLSYKAFQLLAAQVKVVVKEVHKTGEPLYALLNVPTIKTQ